MSLGNHFDSKVPVVRSFNQRFAIRVTFANLDEELSVEVRFSSLLLVETNDVKKNIT